MSKETDILMGEALRGGCCARHVALGQSDAPQSCDGPCGELSTEDVGTMIEVGFEALGAKDPSPYAKGAIGAVLVLCATLAAERERRGAP